MKNNEIKKPAKLEIENAKIRFRNFSGRETDYNPKGNRKFAVFLDDETANVLINDGWNVKYKKAREEGDSDIPYIDVAVRFDNNRPPQIYRVSGKNMTLENEDTVGDLDYAEIENADLIIVPAIWHVGNKSGIKAYLSKAWITISRSRFDDKYDSYRRDFVNNDFDEEENPFE
jgi:hypothetical protein